MRNSGGVTRVTLGVLQMWLRKGRMRGKRSAENEAYTRGNLWELVDRKNISIFFEVEMSFLFIFATCFDKADNNIIIDYEEHEDIYLECGRCGFRDNGIVQ